MKRPYLSMFLALSILPWLLLTPRPAFGQGTTWAGASLAKMLEGARWRLGALRVNGAFSLTNVGYDSDVFFGYAADPVPDFTLSASTAVHVLLPLSKEVILDLYDSPQYAFYLDTRSERAWNNVFRGQLHFAFNRFYFQLGGGLSDVRYRLSPELYINVRQKQDSLDGLVLWKLSKKASLAFVYDSVKYDFGDAAYMGRNLSDSLNRKEDYFDFFTYIEPSPKVRFFVDGQYGRYEFTKVEFRVRNAQSYGIFGGIEFIPKTREQVARVDIEGSLRLGYQLLDIIDPRFMDGSGITGAADVYVTFMKRNTAHAFFSRGFQFSYDSSSSYFLPTAYGVGISRLLSRKIAFSYDISLGRCLYPEDPAAGPEAVQGVHNLYTIHSLSLNFRLARDLELALLGSLGKRSLNQAGPVKNRNFFGFNLVYGTAEGTMLAPSGGLRRWLPGRG